MNNKTGIIVLIACGIALVFGAVYFYAFDSKMDLNGDNVHYMLLAKNIAEGHGYTSLVYGEGFKPASHFPPGYPFILSLLMMVGCNSLFVFKLLNGLFLLASLLLLAYVVWRSSRQTALAIAVAVLPIFSSHLQHFANIVMSEMSFLFFVVLCLFALFKVDNAQTLDKGAYNTLRSRWFYIAIASAMAAYHIRTVGMACVVALFAFFLFRRQWKELGASIVGVLLLLLPWTIRNKMYGIESRYFGTIMTVNPWRPEEGTISSFGEMWNKMLQNFDETVIKGFVETLFPFVSIDYNTPSNFKGILLGCIVLAFVLYGAWNLKPLRWFMLTFILANIGLFMLWHGGNGVRYVVPIFPIIYVCFYTGIFALINQLLCLLQIGNIAKWVPCSFFVMIFGLLPTLRTQAEISRMPYPRAYDNYFALARYANSRDDMRGAVICCRKPELFEYHAPNVYTVNYLYTQNSLELIADLYKRNVQYVVLEQLGYSSTARYLYPAIMDYPALFPESVKAYASPNTYLLRFDREQAAKVIEENEWKFAE